MRSRRRLMRSASDLLPLTAEFLSRRFESDDKLEGAADRGDPNEGESAAVRLGLILGLDGGSAERGIERPRGVRACECP